MRIRVIFLAALLLATSAAFAWHGPGHERVAREAVAALPASMPAFFRAGGDIVAHCALDPDNFCKPIATSQLSDTERPEHYFDVENVPDLDHLPASRYKFLQSVFEHKLTPAQVGMLPYAISEWTERLTIAFAEYRRWPDDPAIQAKTLVFAGLLSHYSADLCQPLHTTIHYDGRVVVGESRVRGIHLKMDAGLGKLGPWVSRHSSQAAPFDDVLGATVAEIKRSHALVDRVYELEGELPAYEAPLDQHSKVAEFLRERLKAATVFTASLYLTAWRNSANVTLPAWHHRPAITPDKMPLSQPAGAMP